MSFAERLRKGDEIAYLVTLVAALTIILITALLAEHLWTNSLLSRQKFGFHFLTSRTWDPVNGNFGALPFVYGTVLTSFLGLLIAVPVGIGAAIFLAEMAPRKISNVLTFLVELLAAVPSVIFGLIGIFVLVPILNQVVPPITDHLAWLPIFSGTFYGVSYLTAGIVLSIMIVPFIVSISREVLMSVPTAQREAMMALGATKWDVTWKAVVPYAQRGIIGSVFLSLARALGETMAVTMVIGNVPEIHASLLSPGYTIAAVIANEFTEATEDIYLHALVEMALVLFVVTMIVNAGARLLMLTAGIKEIRE
ncbi:phosphate ABC transporter membrane protein 1, PhoT family [Granulicella pectinivorans]|jgi:phosphate transport system permease protein|uniref:Phosphate transport system permease protein n=2 Tax=Granulicella pectinivorans TaxID=474950 RepID=A0A1I6L952_9BACT|nr:phosphate ABC transporter membrane protein 1, PhoT family [Granulicella pectinivorans]